MRALPNGLHQHSGGISSAEREELRQLVEQLPDSQLPGALADVRRHLTVQTRRECHRPGSGIAGASPARTVLGRRRRVIGSDGGESLSVDLAGIDLTDEPAWATIARRASSIRGQAKITERRCPEGAGRPCWPYLVVGHLEAGHVVLRGLVVVLAPDATVGAVDSRLVEW